MSKKIPLRLKCIVEKEGETLKRILYADINDKSARNYVGFESRKSEKKTSNNFALKITKLKKIIQRCLTVLAGAQTEQ